VPLPSYQKPSSKSVKLFEIMSLPAAYTKGADALGRSQSKYVRKTVNFGIDEFNRIVRQIEKLARAGAVIDPAERGGPGYLNSQTRIYKWIPAHRLSSHG
jgi:hypothetical protein